MFTVPGVFVLIGTNSIVNCLFQIVYIPIVIYVPSLAFNQGKYPDTLMYVEYVHKPTFPLFHYHRIVNTLNRLHKRLMSNTVGLYCYNNWTMSNASWQCNKEYLVIKSCSVIFYSQLLKKNLIVDLTRPTFCFHNNPLFASVCVWVCETRTLHFNNSHWR